MALWEGISWVLAETCTGAVELLAASDREESSL